MFGLQTLAKSLKKHQTEPAVFVTVSDLPDHIEPDSIAIFTDTYGNEYEAYVNFETGFAGNKNITFWDWVLGEGEWHTASVPAHMIEDLSPAQFTALVLEVL